jgi:hypothetical protein
MSAKGVTRSPSLLLNDAGISSRPSVQDKSGHSWNRSQVSRLVHPLWNRRRPFHFLDRYASLPTLRHKYPFLAQVQLPILDSYRKRIASSLDAFETLASTFARAVPGALAGHSRENGLGMDTAKMTSGVGGLQRLTKAWISAKWLMDAMERWGDEMVGASRCQSTQICC